MQHLSVIIPTFNESSGIVDFLSSLASLRRQGAELIVVDGGSHDGTPALAQPHADRVIATSLGRACQMNAGAKVARGRLLLFLHADCRLPADAMNLMIDAIARGAQWGRFDVCIEGRHSMLRVVAAMINLRSRLSNIATGDQGIFVLREAFSAVGGYPAIPLMEDIALSDLLRKKGRPACLKKRLITSGRRWDNNGVWRTIWLMWCLRAAYRLGVSPQELARIYYPPTRVQ
ncbi:MAG: glycosyl transferase [Sideroxydans sp.]|nr:glycosyl transferase [Sideroxydans sp.]